MRGAFGVLARLAFLFTLLFSFVARSAVARRFFLDPLGVLARRELRFEDRDAEREDRRDTEAVLDLERVLPRFLGFLGVRARRAALLDFFVAPRSAARFFDLPLGVLARRERLDEERRDDRREDALDLERLPFLGFLGVRARRADRLEVERDFEEDFRELEARLEPFGARARRATARLRVFELFLLPPLLLLGAFGVRARRTELLRRREVDLFAFFGLADLPPSLRARFLIPIKRFLLAIMSTL